MILKIVENENGEDNNNENQNQQQSLEEEQNQQSKNQEFEMENIVPEIEFDPSMNDQEAMLEDSDDESIPQSQRQPPKDGNQGNIQFLLINLIKLLMRKT